MLRHVAGGAFSGIARSQEIYSGGESCKHRDVHSEPGSAGA